MLAQIINPLISLGLVVALARLKGAAGLGGYTFAISMMGIFEVIARLGIREYVIREINKSPEQWRPLFTSGIVLGLGSALLAQIAMLLIFKIAGYESDILHSLRIISFALLPSVIYYVFESILFAFDRMTLVGAISIGETLVRVGASVGLLTLGMGADGLLLAYVASEIFIMLLALGAIIKYIGKPARVWKASVFEAMLKATPTFFALAILASFYWRLDILILSRVLGTEAVGQYSAAYRVMYMLVLVGNNVLTAVYPTMTRIFHQGGKNFELLLDKASKYLLMIYLPAAIGVSFLSPKIVHLIFGGKFDTAIPALRILIWVALPYTLNKLFSSGLIAANQQRLDLRVNVYRLALSVSLHLLLITWFGIIGACVATLVSCVASVLMQLYFLRGMVRYKIVFAHLFKPGLSSALMVLGLTLTTAWPLALQIFAGAAIYLAALFIFRPFDGEDRRLLQSLSPRISGEIA